MSTHFDLFLPVVIDAGPNAGVYRGLPRCPNLDGSTLRIVPAYIEAGQFCEANCITVTDGERTAVYVPLTDTN